MKTQSFLPDGYPDFEVNEKVLLFLSRDDSDIATDEDYYVLTGMRQGKYDLSESRKPHVRVILSILI